MKTTDDGSYKEAELLQRLAAGDKKAFNTIYQYYNSMILSAAIVYVKDIDQARDIVQQVFVEIWEKRGRAVHIENFQHYIIVTARNLIYDHVRKQSARSSSEAP